MNKSGWTRQRTNNLRDELIWGWIPSGDKVYHCTKKKKDIAVIYISNKKKSVAIIDALILFIFSSPEHNMLRMSYCDRSMTGIRLSVRVSGCLSVNNYLKNLLLWNRSTDFNETSQKWSLGDALSENFKDLNSMKNSGCHGNRKKKL